MARVVALLLFAAAALVQSVTSQDKLQGGNCIKVPTMCHDLIKNYTHMRLPNMLNQTRDTDVSADLNLWYPLLQSETCNAGNQLKYFLCFTYAPVCVDNDSVKKLIAPCRSVCQTVRYACEPVMRKNNYSWPEVFDCDKKHRFLDDASQMCISTMILNSMKPSPTAPPTVASTASHSDKCSCRKDYKGSRLRSLYCRSHLVTRGRLVGKNTVKSGSGKVYKFHLNRVLRSTKGKKEDFVRKTLSMTVFNDKPTCRCGKLLRSRNAKKHSRANFFIMARREKQRGEWQVDAIGKWKYISSILKANRRKPSISC